MHVCTHILPYTCVHVYHAGSIVVQGIYMKQIKIFQHGIHFIDYEPDNKVYQYSHLIVATTLHLHAAPHVHGRKKWRLGSDDHQKILHVIKEWVEPEHLS